MTRSFTENGTPWSGPSRAPRRMRARSAAFASRRACSSVSVTKAFSRGLTASMRASTAPTTSTGDTVFLRINAASSVADSQASLASAINSPPGSPGSHRPRLASRSGSAKSRVERVAQRIAQQVRAEDREADGEAGEEDEVRRLLGVLGGRDRQHAAPRRVRLGHAEPEVRQGRLDEDRAAELGRAQHDERSDGVGQDVPERDAQVPDAERARRLDVLHLTDGQDAGA